MEQFRQESRSRSNLAASRLARARVAWRRAADELLIDAIFDDMRSVRRDGDCAGRLLRQEALGGAARASTQTGAQQLRAPVF